MNGLANLNDECLSRQRSSEFGEMALHYDNVIKAVDGIREIGERT
jgi:hypothetical protein